MTDQDTLSKIIKGLEREAQRSEMFLAVHDDICSLVDKVKKMTLDEALASPKIEATYSSTISLIDRALEEHNDPTTYTKYTSLSEALKHYIASNVLISVDKTCYIFKDYKSYKEFDGDVGYIKFRDSTQNFDHTKCMYYVIPSGSTHKPVLYYKSNNEEEINTIMQHISTSLNTPIDLIERISTDDKSYLRLNGIVGTYQGYGLKLLECVMDADDKKLQIVKPQMIDGHSSLVLPVIQKLMKESKLKDGTVIQNIMIHTGSGNIVTNFDMSDKKKYSCKGAAKEWISKNPPSRKTSPTQYHLDYSKAHFDKKTFDFKQFGTVMRKIGYEVTAGGSNRYWKFISEDSDDD